jgi:transcriptional regulator GlxA family with amidase domain
MDRRRLGILIFNDVEVLDFCGPFEVFSVARLDEARRRSEPSPFEVLLVAETMAPVTTSGGMEVRPMVDFSQAPDLDILLVPGGQGTRREMNNPAVLDFVRRQAQGCERVASVCTGALVLGKAGLLDGRRATTHWQALELLRELCPAVTVDAEAQVVDEGEVMTSAGIAAGIDLALLIVRRCHGEAVARATAAHMEYPFPEGYGRRVARTGVAVTLEGEPKDGHD